MKLYKIALFSFSFFNLFSNNGPEGYPAGYAESSPDLYKPRSNQHLKLLLAAARHVQAKGLCNIRKYHEFIYRLGYESGDSENGITAKTLKRNPISKYLGSEQGLESFAVDYYNTFAGSKFEYCATNDDWDAPTPGGGGSESKKDPYACEVEYVDQLLKFFNKANFIGSKLANGVTFEIKRSNNNNLTALFPFISNTNFMMERIKNYFGKCSVHCAFDFNMNIRLITNLWLWFTIPAPLSYLSNPCTLSKALGFLKQSNWDRNTAAQQLIDLINQNRAAQQVGANNPMGLINQNRIFIPAVQQAQPQALLQPQVRVVANQMPPQPQVPQAPVQAAQPALPHAYPLALQPQVPVQAAQAVPAPAAPQPANPQNRRPSQKKQPPAKRVNNG